MFQFLRSLLVLTLCSAGLGVGQSTGDKAPATVPPAPPQAGPSMQSPAKPSSPTASTPNAGALAAKSDSSAAASDPLADALSLYRQGNLTAAIEKYQQILQADPKSTDAYSGLARAYLKQRNVDLASETITKGRAVSDSPALHVALGEVYFRQGKIPEAEQEWVKVIKSGHLEARAFLGLARVRNALSMYKNGKAMIDEAHELDPRDPDIQLYWIRTLLPSERIEALRSNAATGENGSAEARAGSQRDAKSVPTRVTEPRRSCHLVSNVSSTESSLERLLRDSTHLRGYGLTVELNGHKARLLLDTGASGILIDRSVAEKAGISKLGETRLGGIGDQGLMSGYVGLASSIKVGALEFQDCPVRVLEQRSVVDQDGLIGADVFQDFLVDIDFPKEELRLSPLPKRPDDEAGPSGPVALRTNHDEEDSSSTADEADGTQPNSGKKLAAASFRFRDSYVAPEMKSYTHVYRFGHDLLVPTKVGDSPIKLFLLDTGAWNNQITPAAAREVTKVRESSTRIKGVSGSVNNVYTSDKAILQFGHLRQENQDLIAFDLTSISNSVGTEISGTLGFAMLRLLDIKIDYRDGLVDLDYKSH